MKASQAAVLGFLAGAIAVGVPALFAFKKSSETRNQTSAVIQKRVDDCGVDRDALQIRIAGLQRAQETAQVTIQASAGWYTLVYAPGAAAGPSPLELANIFRPGLGTLLAKMAPPTPAQFHVRYILSGHVYPLVQPGDGSVFVYTRDPNAVVNAAAH